MVDGEKGEEGCEKVGSTDYGADSFGSDWVAGEEKGGEQGEVWKCALLRFRGW